MCASLLLFPSPPRRALPLRRFAVEDTVALGHHFPGRSSSFKLHVTHVRADGAARQAYLEAVAAGDPLNMKGLRLQLSGSCLIGGKPQASRPG